jgi:hypothetical protein
MSGITVGRPHPITMLAFAENVGARVLGDGVVARQEHRPRENTRCEDEACPGACYRTVRSRFATVRHPLDSRAASTSIKKR